MSVLAFQPRLSPAICAVCEADDVYPIRDLDGDQSLIECGRCGVWSVHPRPSPEALREVYDESYYAPWRHDAAARLRMWRGRLRLLSRARRGRLLDVGCAEGGFMSEARKAGFDVQGTELSPHGARKTSRRLGVPVHCGDLVDADHPPSSFSVVSFWHVLEHMVQPGEALREARRILEPEGLLVVAVPNLENRIFQAAYRVARRRPVRLYHPSDREQHLHHWKPASLRAALETVGFEVTALRPDPCALGAVKRAIDLAGRLHSLLAREPRTSAMVALARPVGVPT